MGTTIICSACGHCIYLDRLGNTVIPEQRKVAAGETAVTKTSEPCGQCQQPWENPYPRTGQREQCARCGALRYPGTESPRGTPAARSIAALMEMRCLGMPQVQMAKNFVSLPDEPPKMGNAARWIRECSRIALASDGMFTIMGSEQWDIVTIPLKQGPRDSHLAVIMDSGTGMILSTQICAGAVMDAAVIKAAAARVRNLPLSIRTNIDSSSLDIAVNMSMTIRRKICRISTTDLTIGTRLEEFTRIIQRWDTNARRKSSHDLLQTFASAAAHDLNFFRVAAGPSGKTPAQAAGIQATCLEWEDVAARLITQKQKNRYHHRAPEDEVQASPTNDETQAQRPQLPEMQTKPEAPGEPTDTLQDEHVSRDNDVQAEISEDPHGPRPELQQEDQANATEPAAEIPPTSVAGCSCSPCLHPEAEPPAGVDVLQTEPLNELLQQFLDNAIQEETRLVRTLEQVRTEIRDGRALLGTLEKRAKAEAISTQ